MNPRERSADVDLSTYSRQAIVKAAYRFSGKCFVRVEDVNPQQVKVILLPKTESSDPDLLVGDFLNELLDQRLREIVAAETLETRNLILAHALSKTNLIRPDLSTAEPSADPGQISVPDRNRSSAPFA